MLQSLRAGDISRPRAAVGADRPAPSPDSGVAVDNELIHRWYRIIMGFDARLVRRLIAEFSIQRGNLVLDPFCGSGTTLVECQQLGIPAVGIDANPVCVLASRVKTNWQLHPETLETLPPVIVARGRVFFARSDLTRHEALQYLTKSGMITRGWISSLKARKVIALLLAIEATCVSPASKQFFLLALLSAVVRKIADIKFGPEVYCLKKRRRKKVVASFLWYARMMIGDLYKVRGRLDSRVRSKVILGDSRYCGSIVNDRIGRPADFILTSPPYPNEHDYTRCTRLELIILGHVRSLDELRSIKRTMLRCHTKGIYVGDSESNRAVRFRPVRAAISKLERRAYGRSDGFSQLYGRVIGEYFGGMLTHLRGAYEAVKPGGVCAYVVCDQQSLLGVYVNTPEILRRIATTRSVGFRFVKSMRWKRTRGSTGQRQLTERVLVLEKPR